MPTPIPLPSSPDSPSCDLAACKPAYEKWRHALRGPLNAILTATAVLETCPADSASAVEARHIIARQTRNLAWLISDLPGEESPAE